MPTPGNSVNESHMLPILKEHMKTERELFRKRKGISENEREKMEQWGGDEYDQNILYMCMEIY